MSTDAHTRRGATRRRRGRAFALSFAAVIAALVVVVLGGAAASSTQGPRATAVHVDPSAAATTSGARLIVTTNQSLHEVDPSQITIAPAAAFTVDTAGRQVGIRFPLPLQDDTEYAVTIERMTGFGGGPDASVTETFRTPPLQTYLLQRTSSGDTIYRTGLAERDSEPIYRAEHIEDFRVTSGHIVVATEDDDGEAALIVTGLDGGGERELLLPGEGTVTSLQSADRGDLIGYTFTDASLGEGTGRESALFTASLRDDAPDEEPTAVAVGSVDTRVADWRFVPDTDSLLVLTFDGRLLLSAASGEDAADLGSALTIDGIARGASTAVIERADGMFALDLTDGTETPLVDAAGVEGTQGISTPMPGDAAGTIRPYSIVDDGGIARGTTVYRVADDGAATPLYEAPGTDAVLQTCVSPSGQYLAVLVAPDVVANPYDTYDLPLPATVDTHVVRTADGEEVVDLPGFGISWCQVPPPVQ